MRIQNSDNQKYLLTYNINEGKNMTKALVCMTAEVDSSPKLLKKLRASDAMEEAYMLFGVYDIIAKVKADSSSNLQTVITEKILKHKEIQKTMTVMIAEP